jgi:amidase
MPNSIKTISAFSQFSQNLGKAQKGVLKNYQFAVKDVFDVKGFATQAGNPDYYANSKIANVTAPAVSKLQDEGALLLGKTHTDELGASLFGINEHYGTPKNPKYTNCVPGGSSSGSASAVAEKQVDFALGADTSGSVRAPASFCGIYGYRSTFGALPTKGILPISPHLDTVGIFSYNSQILPLILKIYGIKENSQFTSIKIISSLVNTLKEPLKNPFLDKCKSIEDYVSQVIQFDLDEQLLDKFSNANRIISLYGLWKMHGNWITNHSPRFGKFINYRLQLARSISKDDYKSALDVKKNTKLLLIDNLGDNELFLFPTVHDTAPPLTTSFEDLKEFSIRASRHTCLASLTGCPEITLPINNTILNGSLGLSLMALPNRDLDLVSFASSLHSLFN